MNKAIFIKTLDGFKGDAYLYKVVPPMPKGHKYVAVSAVVAPFTGPECYIFPARASGKVVDWTELPGSYRGGMDPAEALRRAGYEIEYAKSTTAD